MFGATEHSPTTIEILNLFQERGQSQYGGEVVSQLEHALQAAFFAELARARPELIVAALLHDVGHLLHDLPEDAPEQGLDDRHEALAARWLEQRFPREIVDPVLLHVDAKRYLCATDEDYTRQLSGPSLLSMQLQGGPMSPAEQAAFRLHPHWEAALNLRRWDDAAKVPRLKTPPLEHYAGCVDQVLRK